MALVAAMPLFISSRETLEKTTPTSRTNTIATHARPRRRPSTSAPVAALRDAADERRGPSAPRRARHGRRRHGGGASLRGGDGPLSSAGAPLRRARASARGAPVSLSGCVPRAALRRLAAAGRSCDGGVGACHQAASTERSLRATRSLPERARGLSATSPGVGAIAREFRSSASGSCPQTQIGSSGGQMQPRAFSARKRLTRRSSSEWNEIAPNRPPSARTFHAAGSARSSAAELVVDRDADRLEHALGRVAARELRRHRDRRLDRLDQVVGRLEFPARAATRDRAGDRAREALLAVLVEELGQAPLVPAVDDVARVELLRRVHSHVERCVVGVGEAALPGVDLHR